MPAPEEPGGKTEYAPGRAGLPAETWLLLGASTELPQITAQALELAVPRLAAAAGVLVHERLLAGGPGGAEGGDLVVRRIGARFADGTPLHEAAFPAGEVLALSAASPFGRCAASGSPVLFTPSDDQTLDHARFDSRAFLERYSWFLAVPMIARGTVAGLMTFARTSARAAFDDDDVALAAKVAERAGACIVNTCLLDRYQRTAKALQEALLPAEPALPAGIEVAGRCLPAGDLVGGDFYDVIPLPSGQTGLIVGDVMGHGIAAAATMAQLRTTAHALAEMELAPAELLTRLDRATSALKHPIYATCAYAIIDGRYQHATVALAGHLPPVLAVPGDRTHVPDIPSGMSLGLGTSALGEARIRMPAGSILALFTDGLVETRTRPYDQGIRMLRTVLARKHESLLQACDAAITELGHNLEDDITLVLARIPRTGQVSLSGEQNPEEQGGERAHPGQRRGEHMRKLAHSVPADRKHAADTSATAWRRRGAVPVWKAGWWVREVVTWARRAASGGSARKRTGSAGAASRRTPAAGTPTPSLLRSTNSSRSRWARRPTRSARTTSAPWPNT